ncbi:aldehyde dehydrogenase family protein [Saccharospirillum sp. MSK14-1]|uniref:aldehyde dehydrogenase family protein n=1 Tax=Saccharospirillum sp. MSK14-1 TaxID=1897632 RepID=UPI001304ACCC|nr:aldehyde dehydrogenase family protein [Saccharospirillum sp. MSK14-1]
MTVFRSVNPATGELLGQWPMWTDAQLQAVVDEQASLWPDLANTPLAQRLAWLADLGELLAQQRHTLALCMTHEMGKPLAQAEAEIDKTRALIEYVCVQAPQRFEPTSLLPGVERKMAALGGVLGIMPWNYPLWQLARFALPALAIGNTVTIKPAPNVWQSAALLEQWVGEAGFPRAALRVVRADIQQLPLLYDHPHLRQVHFTGSRDVGRRIAAACGERLKPTTLELGGNDAWLLTDSGDVSAFVKAALTSRLNNSGQSCLCAKRWLVPKSRLERVLALVEAALPDYQPMSPELPESRLGPLARADLRDQLLSQWRRLSADALRRSSDPVVDGQFVSPAWAVVDDPLTSQVWPEEVFGPVIQLAAYEFLDQAIAWANHSEYGLGGSVWDADPQRASALAMRLHTANVAINRPMRSRIDVSFGGRAASGWGVELGQEGIAALMRGQVQYVDG